MNKTPLIRLNGTLSNDEIFKQFQVLISKEECEKSNLNLSTSERFIGVAIYMKHVTHINLLRCMFDYIRKMGFLHSSISIGNEIQKLEDVLNSDRPISLKSNIISAAFQWEMLVHEYKEIKEIDVPPLKTKIDGRFFYNNIDKIEEYIKDKKLSIRLENRKGLNFKQNKRNLNEVIKAMIKSDLDSSSTHHEKQISYLDSYISAMEEDENEQKDTVTKAVAEPSINTKEKVDIGEFINLEIFNLFKKYVETCIPKNAKFKYREYSFICQKMIELGYVKFNKHMAFAAWLNTVGLMDEATYKKVFDNDGFKTWQETKSKIRVKNFDLIFNQ